MLHSVQLCEPLRAVAVPMAGSSAGGAAVTVQHDAQPMVWLLNTWPLWAFKIIVPQR